MQNNEWLEIIAYLTITVLLLLAIIFKVSWLISVCLIIVGIIGILAAIFKWEEILFYNHFWLDLDDNIWYRILNGVIGVIFIVGGVLILVLNLSLW